MGCVLKSEKEHAYKVCFACDGGYWYLWGHMFIWQYSFSNKLSWVSAKVCFSYFISHDRHYICIVCHLLCVKCCNAIASCNGGGTTPVVSLVPNSHFHELNV